MFSPTCGTASSKMIEDFGEKNPFLGSLAEASAEKNCSITAIRSSSLFFSPPMSRGRTTRRSFMFMERVICA